MLNPHLANSIAYDFPMPFVDPVITAHPPLYHLYKSKEGLKNNQ